ncbi:hypothetical protein ZIOFF_002423 [Zingiber officinale]|uniref:Uncharacterized protein n=1 Tax=Zingiber officinale TaxID=94328 RepID=A0A8J5ILU4_ZINOF|nr:hypothetical protein ZIOFF_002423 [Zingiber officinale]
MNFLGMELQAVPPSVIHPPMSEKVIRAKKYLKRKAAKALELKNARETRRKSRRKGIDRSKVLEERGFGAHFDGESGEVISVITLADNGVVGQHHHVRLNLLRQALGTRRRQVQPHTDRAR